MQIAEAVRKKNGIVVLAELVGATVRVVVSVEVTARMDIAVYVTAFTEPAGVAVRVVVSVDVSVLVIAREVDAA